ncbi:MAG: hypothetical protein LBR94_07500, partial [Desulfovibrio sp.]|nr:hypothetical protein [Desulfovibrio sp.]
MSPTTRVGDVLQSVGYFEKSIPEIFPRRISPTLKHLALVAQHIENRENLCGSLKISQKYNALNFMTFQFLLHRI